MGYCLSMKVHGMHVTLKHAHSCLDSPSRYLLGTSYPCTWREGPETVAPKDVSVICIVELGVQMGRLHGAEVPCIIPSLGL